METISSKYLPDMDFEQPATPVLADTAKLISESQKIANPEPDVAGVPKSDIETGSEKKTLYNPFSSSENEPGVELPNPFPEATEQPQKPLLSIISSKKDQAKSPSTKKSVKFSENTETIESQAWSSDEETQDENDVQQVGEAEKSVEDIEEIVDEIVEEISQKKPTETNDDEICVLEDASSETLTSTPIKDEKTKPSIGRDPIYYSELSDCEIEPREKRRRRSAETLREGSQEERRVHPRNVKVESASRRIIQEPPRSRHRRSAPAAGGLNEDKLARTVASILPASPYSQSLLDSLTRRDQRIRSSRPMVKSSRNVISRPTPAIETLDDSDIIIDTDFELIKQLESELARTCKLKKRPSDRMRTRSSRVPVVQIKRCDYMLRGNWQAKTNTPDNKRKVSASPLSFWESAECGNLLPEMFELISTVFRKKFRRGSSDYRKSLTTQLNALIEELNMGDLLKSKLQEMKRNAKSELTTFEATIEEKQRNMELLQRQLMETQQSIEAERQNRRAAERKASVLESLVDGKRRRY